jgi:hypothetical protein
MVIFSGLNHAMPWGHGGKYPDVLTTMGPVVVGGCVTNIDYLNNLKNRIQRILFA